MMTDVPRISSVFHYLLTLSDENRQIKRVELNLHNPRLNLTTNITIHSLSLIHISEPTRLQSI